MRTHFSIAVEIPGPQPLVWAVIADVERWPEWTASVNRIIRLTPGPIAVGSRWRIHQPKLPPAWWRVTEVTPGLSFTWASEAPGVRVLARHNAEGSASGTRVTLSVRYEGLLGPLLARMVGALNNRYLAIEARGLEARCAELAAKSWPKSPSRETI